MSIKVIRTCFSKNEKLAEVSSVDFTHDVEGIENRLVNVYDDVQYQEIVGFGGAFTEASAVTIDKLNAEDRLKVIEAYFNPLTGIGYSLCRTHINSCDFSTGNYAYVETEDPILESFDIGRDKQSLLPFIKSAKEIEGASFNIFASPWSPPAWMKTTGMMNRGGKLKAECKDAWARYFAKYIKAYASEGINIWGVTVQNEPKATQSWDSCVFTAEEEAEFVGSHLGPVLQEEGHGDVKIIIWDHNKERLWDRTKVAYSNPEVAKYVWGAGIHWYSGDHFESLSIVHDQYPDKKILFTEGCVGVRPPKEWYSPGEQYAHDIIGNLNNWAVGWVDWNMVLDEMGGPNHVGNFCDAPIRVDTTKGTYEFHSSYYYLGHFSKYIRPGARRIGFSRFSDRLEVTAFKNVDGTCAVIVLNRSDGDIAFTLRAPQGIGHIESPSHSISTLIY